MWDSQTSFQLKDRSFDTTVGWSEIYRERDFCSAAMAWSFFQSLYRIRSFDSSYSAATTSDNGVRSPTSAILPAGVLPPSRSVQNSDDLRCGLLGMGGCVLRSHFFRCSSPAGCIGC